MNYNWWFQSFKFSELFRIETVVAWSNSKINRIRKSIRKLVPTNALSTPSVFPFIINCSQNQNGWHERNDSIQNCEYYCHNKMEGKITRLRTQLHYNENWNCDSIFWYKTCKSNFPSNNTICEQMRRVCVCVCIVNRCTEYARSLYWHEYNPTRHNEVKIIYKSVWFSESTIKTKLQSLCIRTSVVLTYKIR